MTHAVRWHEAIFFLKAPRR